MGSSILKREWLVITPESWRQCKTVVGFIISTGTGTTKRDWHRSYSNHGRLLECQEGGPLNGEGKDYIGTPTFLREGTPHRCAEHATSGAEMLRD